MVKTQWRRNGEMSNKVIECAMVENQLFRDQGIDWFCPVLAVNFQVRRPGDVADGRPVFDAIETIVPAREINARE